jgi:hypothetical protein
VSQPLHEAGVEADAHERVLRENERYVSARSVSRVEGAASQLCHTRLVLEAGLARKSL